MPRVLVFWTVIIAVVAAALIWRAVRQRRSMPRPDPGCSADDAWTHYFTGAGSLNERDRRAIGAFPSLGAEAGEAIRERVTSVVESACRSEDPQTALRIALMDATDRFVLGETVHEARHADHGAREIDTDAEHVGAVIEAGVLRAFAKLRLGDAAGQDWYTHYLDVACMNSRNVAAMVRKTVEGDASSLEASLHEPLSGKMRDVRATLLSVSPRQPIARSEETDARDARRQQPSRRQVDDAIRVMSARLERLFTGEVYRSASGSPIERSVAFHIDAGILYCMLARTFRYPDDAWTKILAESLGPYRGAVESRHELLESMREYHALWEANEHDGPLQALIDAAGGGNDVGGEPAPGMMLDASYLVGQVREIVERSDDPAAERRR